MEFEPVFTGNDLLLIESLPYNRYLQPSYDIIKNCLVWADERVDGLTPAGYEALCDLWIARSYLHRGLDFSAHPLDPEYFRDIWQRALKQGFSWPGFQRLTLDELDRAYYEQEIREAHLEEESPEPPSDGQNPVDTGKDDLITK